MKHIPVWLLVCLLLVSGCGGKDSVMKLNPLSGTRTNQGKNPGGTGRVTGGTAALFGEPSAKAEKVGEFPEETQVILEGKRRTKEEGVWIRIRRKTEKGWVEGWVRSEHIQFNWKEDSLDKLPEY